MDADTRKKVLKWFYTASIGVLVMIMFAGLAMAFIEVYGAYAQLLSDAGVSIG